MAKATIFIVALLLGSSLASLEDWDTWKQTFGKNYQTKEEEVARKAIFLSNVDSINSFNLLQSSF